MHIVTCMNCRQKFDRDKIPFIQISSKRFQHKCCPPEEEIEIKELAKKWLKETYNTKLVNKQITELKQEGATSETILKVLKYTIEIKKLSAEGARGGIGILPYVWNEARLYYNQLEDINNSLVNTSIISTAAKEITVKPPKPKRDLIDLETL